MKLMRGREENDPWTLKHQIEIEYLGSQALSLYKLKLKGRNVIMQNATFKTAEAEHSHQLFSHYQ